MYVAVPTVTARYYPNPKKSLERALFSADINPTPLLELVAQEMAFRAKGKVRVYIEAEKDTYALRNVLKVRRCNLLTVAFSVCLSVCVLLSTLSLSPPSLSPFYLQLSARLVTSLSAVTTPL